MFFLRLDDQLFLYNHYLRYGLQVIKHLYTESKDFEETKRNNNPDPFNEAVLDLAKHTIAQANLRLGIIQLSMLALAVVLSVWKKPKRKSKPSADKKPQRQFLFLISLGKNCRNRMAAIIYQCLSRQ